eukprot:9658543-Ditylum_brightwellii.AAC.1
MDMKVWIKANQPYIYSCIKLRKIQDKKKLKDIRSFYYINRKKMLPRKRNNTKRRKHKTKRHASTSPSITKFIKPSPKKNKTTTHQGSNNPIHSRPQAWKTSCSQQEAMTSVNTLLHSTRKAPGQDLDQGINPGLLPRQ